MRWFYLMSGEEKLGPMTVEELQEHVQAGRANADTPYWEEGLEEWEPLVNVMPELAEAQAPAGYEVAREAPALAAPALGTGAVAPSLAAGGMAAQIRHDAHELQVGGRFVFIGWVVTFVTVVLVMMKGSWNGFLALGGLCGLVAVVMAVGGMAKRRVGPGIILLVAALALPLGTYYYVTKNKLTAFGWQADKEPASAVSFTQEQYMVDGVKVTYSAVVTNLLERPLGNVAVKVVLSDAEGAAVATGTSSVTETGSLPPGASAKVEVVVEGDATVAGRKRTVSYERL